MIAINIVQYPANENEWLRVLCFVIIISSFIICGVKLRPWDVSDAEARRTPLSSALSRGVDFFPQFKQQPFAYLNAANADDEQQLTHE